MSALLRCQVTLSLFFSGSLVVFGDKFPALAVVGLSISWAKIFYVIEVTWGLMDQSCTITKEGCNSCFFFFRDFGKLLKVRRGKITKLFSLSEFRDICNIFDSH